MQLLILALRSFLFYIGYISLTIWFTLTAVFFLLFAPYKVKYFYLTRWNYSVVWWLRLTCGVKFEVQGLDNIKKENRPLLLLAKHQSQWETFFIPTVLSPLAPILKQELLKIPGFGWGLKMVNPIAIDRSNPKEALKTINREGRDRLHRKISVIIFPEGTRTNYGEVGNYARGGANLAIAAKVPVVFVAHNAGKYWPAHRFIKYPGTIRIAFSEIIDTSSANSRDITARAQEWIEGKIASFE
jgi:1-acyl-sn-glycerol-3-phosphate acyltransferase